MKTKNLIIIFCLISVMSCVTIKNSSGYIITNKSFNNADGKKNAVYKQTFCDGQRAVGWYEIGGFNYLGWVFFNPQSGGYRVEIDGKVYTIDINKIMPLEVGQADALRIAQNAGFNSYSEFQKNFEEQKLLAEEEKRRQQEEERQELSRLRYEVDVNFGVFAVGSLLHAKNGEVQIGQIIRLGDTFAYDTNSWSRLRTGGYIFGDFDEFEIRGLDMAQVNVKEIRADRSGYFMQGGGITAGGRRGYIVKYLGTEEFITQGGFRRVRWVFECIGGNIYAE